MGKITKNFSLMIAVILVISSLLIAKPTNAQTPSAPTFSVNTPSATYQVPTTYSTDPFTGATITNQGYTVNSINITFIIQNTLNTSFYLLQYKGHFSSQWSTLYQDGYNITASTSSQPQTILTIFGTNYSGPIGQTPANEVTFYFSGDWAINLALGSQIDFRLQAISGSLWVNPLYGANYQSAVGEASDWSNTQTITIGETSFSTSPHPTSTPTIPELPTLAIAPLLVSILAILIVLKLKKQPCVKI